MNECEFIVFNLGLEEYAIKICYAQEIIRVPKFSKIPNVPSFINGVFNLRGTIIPVIDLKKRFGITQNENSPDRRLLILDLEGTKIGIVVDDVSEVIIIDDKLIQNLSDDIVKISKDSIEGMSVIDERIIIILNALKLKSEIFKLNLEKGIAI